MRSTSPSPSTLPAWLQAHAHTRADQVALRHKRLGVWHVQTWAQVHGQVTALATALQAAGFAGGESLIVLSGPRPEALVTTLAAQWLGGSAILLDPLGLPGEAIGLLQALPARFVFAEGHAELAMVEAAGVATTLLFHADARGVQRQGQSTYQALIAPSGQPAAVLAATPDQPAFSFYRLAEHRLQVQLLRHGQLLGEGGRLVEHEQLRPDEEALAARAFAASGQARYLLAPWLIAGFRLNFPESVASRDRDRRELGPTLVLGTRHTYGRLHAQAVERLPLPGSLARALVDWALVPRPGLLRDWLVRRPLRDVLGLGRSRVPLLVGEPLTVAAQGFFDALGVAVRAWPDPAQWSAPVLRGSPPGAVSDPHLQPA